MGSNQEGDISSLTERVDTQAGTKITSTSAASNTVSLRTRSKPKDKDKGSEENMQLDPGGEEEKPPPWNAAVMVVFSFPGENVGPGVPVVFASCSLSVCACLPALFFMYCSFQVLTFQRAEKHERRRGSSH